MAGWRARAVFVLALALVPVGSCRSPAAHRPAGRYQKDGLAFDHLSGWIVTKDTQKKAGRIVVVDGPKTAILLMAAFAPNIDISPEEFAHDVATSERDALREKLTIAGFNLGDESEATPFLQVQRLVAGTNVRGLARHSTVRFVGRRTPQIAEFFVVDIARRKLALMDQVADVDRPEVDAGLQRIFDTVTLDY